MPSLIISSDDFGISSSTNESIIRLIHKNRITSTSLLVKRDRYGFDEAIKASLALKGKVSFGLHLDLDDFFYFDENNHYGLDEEDIVEDYITIVHNKREKIIKDIEKQVDFLKNKGIDISHIDGHHSIHQFKEIMHMLIPIMKRKGIKAIRLNQNFYKNDENSREIMDLLGVNNIVFPHFFYDLTAIMNSCEITYYTEQDVIEIMAHTDVSDNSYGKIDQFNFLLNYEFSGYDKITYNDLC